MATYDKPFKNYDELIEIMEQRNIIINNKEFAKVVLSEYSYYSLINGFKNTFLSIGNTDMFSKGTRFEELYALYLIDSNINATIFKYILFVEKSLKSKLSYLVAEHYGVCAIYDDATSDSSPNYLHKSHYSNSNNKRTGILKDLRNCVINPRKNDMLIHYKNTKNHIPPWVFITNVTFGLTIQWYSILKNADKTDICNCYITNTALSIEERKEFLQKSLELLKDYRNKIAHGSRTFNVTNLPKLPKKQTLLLSENQISNREYNLGLGVSDLFALILVFSVLLKDDFTYNSMIYEIRKIFSDNNPSLVLGGKNLFDIYNLPPDFFERITTIRKTFTSI